MLSVAVAVGTWQLVSEGLADVCPVSEVAEEQQLLASERALSEVVAEQPLLVSERALSEVVAEQQLLASEGPTAGATIKGGFVKSEKDFIKSEIVIAS